MTEANEAEYILCVDWDNNGNYTGTYDDISADLLISDSTPVTWNRGRDKQLGRGQAGTLEFYLKNQDGKYSPLNAAGDLYGNLQPGRPVRLQMLSGGDTVDQFHGFISRLTPYPWHGKKNVYFYCVDGMEWLNMAKVAAVAMTSRYECYAPTEWSPSWAQFFDDRYRAQTFTPVISGSLTGAKLLLKRLGFPGDITVSIRATDGDGHPTGGDLCSGVIDGDTLTTEDIGEWREVTFTTACSIIASVKYAIIARIVGGGAPQKPYWAVMEDGSYTRGCFESSGDYGETWTSYSDDDLLFITLGLPSTEEVTAPRTEFQICNALLDAAGWRDDKRDIDESNPQEYAFWETAGSGQSVLSLLQVLETITGGIFYIDKNGNAKWESANYRSVNSAATVYDYVDDMHGLTYNIDKADVWNRIEITIAQVQVSEEDPDTEEEVVHYMRLSTTKHLDLGESYYHTFRLSSGYVSEWKTPTIYATLGLTNDISSSLDVEKVFESRTTCQVKVTNNYTAGEWPFNLVTLRRITLGYVLLVDEEPDEDEDPIDGEWGLGENMVMVEDTDSQDEYTFGIPRIKTINVPFFMEYELAYNLAMFYLAYYKTPVADTTLKLKNDTEDNILAILDMELSNRIGVTFTDFDMIAEFFVNKEQHKVTEGGKFHEVNYTLEKCETQRQIFVWGTSVWGDGSLWGP